MFKRIPFLLLAFRFYKQSTDACPHPNIIVMTASLLQANIYAYYLYIADALRAVLYFRNTKYLMIESAVKTTLATVCP